MIRKLEIRSDNLLLLGANIFPQQVDILVDCALGLGMGACANLWCEEIVVKMTIARMLFDKRFSLITELLLLVAVVCCDCGSDRKPLAQFDITSFPIPDAPC